MHPLNHLHTMSLLQFSDVYFFLLVHLVKHWGAMVSKQIVMDYVLWKDKVQVVNQPEDEMQKLRHKG